MRSMDDLPDVVKSYDFTDALFDLIAPPLQPEAYWTRPGGQNASFPSTDPAPRMG